MLGKHLPQQLQPLCGQVRRLRVQPGDVPPWSGQARHESARNRVISRRHDDGNAGGGFLRRADSVISAGGEEHVDLEADQLGREVVLAIELSLGPPVLNGDVLPFTITEPPRALAETPPGASRRWPVRAATSIRSARPSPPLLRLGGERRGEERRPATQPMNARRSITRSPDPPAAGATAGSSGRGPWRSSG